MSEKPKPKVYRAISVERVKREAKKRQRLEAQQRAELALMAEVDLAVTRSRLRKPNHYFGPLAIVRPALEKELAGLVGPHNPVSLDELDALARIAHRPECVSKADSRVFWQFMATSPDMALRIVTFMRSEFARLRRTDAGQVRLFLRTASVVTDKQGKAVPVQAMPDWRVAEHLWGSISAEWKDHNSKMSDADFKRKLKAADNERMRRISAVKAERAAMRRLEKRTAPERKPGAVEFLRTGRNGPKRNRKKA